MVQRPLQCVFAKSGSSLHSRCRATSWMMRAVRQHDDGHTGALFDRERRRPARGRAVVHEQVAITDSVFRFGSLAGTNSAETCH